MSGPIYMSSPVESPRETSIDFVQWENSHVSLRFPLEDDAILSAVDGRDLPACFVVDMSVFTDGDPASVRLVSAYVGPGLVSMSLADNLGALGMCSVPVSEYEKYAPYRIEGFPGRDAAGICSFGASPSELSEPVLLRFDPGIPVSATACHHVDTGRVRKFVDERSGKSVSGDVRLELGTGLTAFLCSLDDDGGCGKWPCARIFMDRDLGLSVVSPCVGKNDDSRIAQKPVSAINGVSPDCEGRLAIVFS